MATRRTSQRLKDRQNRPQTEPETFQLNQTRLKIGRADHPSGNRHHLSGRKELSEPARRSPRLANRESHRRDTDKARLKKEPPRSTKNAHEHQPVVVILEPNINEQVKDEGAQDFYLHHSSNKHYTEPIFEWLEQGRWPRHLFEPRNEMRLPLAQRKSTASSRRKTTELSSRTPSDERPREEKSAPYAHPRYRTLLETAGSFMSRCKTPITKESKALCQDLLTSPQTLPSDTLFRDDLFWEACRKIGDRNESKVLQDITRLIVPSVESLATFGASQLENLIESVNEGWNESIPLVGPRPQPDYSVGFKPSAFTEEQLQRLSPSIGTIMDQSFFVATWRMYFPFITCEVKCGAGELEVADRQNAHSATLAVRAVVELYRAAEREKELHRELLAFSISHDNDMVRIYGHYPLINQEKVTYHRHFIKVLSITNEDGKDKWTAYRFTRNVYDKFMPIHLGRICSAIDNLSPDSQSGVSQGSELQFSEENPGEQSKLSEPGSAAMTKEDDGQSSLIAAQDATTNTSLMKPRYKKPRLGRKN